MIGALPSSTWKLPAGRRGAKAEGGTKAGLTKRKNAEADTLLQPDELPDWPPELSEGALQGLMMPQDNLLVQYCSHLLQPVALLDATCLMCACLLLGFTLQAHAGHLDPSHACLLLLQPGSEAWVVKTVHDPSRVAARMTDRNQ